MGSAERTVSELYNQKGHISRCVKGTGSCIEIRGSYPHPTPAKRRCKFLWHLGRRRMVVPNTAWDIPVLRYYSLFSWNSTLGGKQAMTESLRGNVV